MSERYGFVMMVREKWWIRFRDRHHEGKRVHSFVLTGSAPPRNARFVLFYVVRPVSALSGYGEFVERKVGEPEKLWEDFGGESVLGSRKEFEGFIGGADKASFVRFKNLREAVNPVALRNLCMLLGGKRLSRKGVYVGKEMCERLLSIME